MKVHIGTFKTLTTLYHDYDSCCWEIDKPEDSRMGEDYCILRKGSILKAYQLDNDEIGDYGYEIVLESTSNSWIGFESIDDLYNYQYVYEVKRPIEGSER